MDKLAQGSPLDGSRGGALGSDCQKDPFLKGKHIGRRRKARVRLPTGSKQRCLNPRSCIPPHDWSVFTAATPSSSYKSLEADAEGQSHTDRSTIPMGDGPPSVTRVAAWVVVQECFGS